MADISISLITIFSFLFGVISGAAILKFITAKKYKYENETLKSRAEYSEALNIKLSGTIADLECNIKEMKTQNEKSMVSQCQLKAEVLTIEAEYIKKTEEAKKIAFEQGKEESLTDYKITCQQFFDYNDGFLSKHSKGGYKFQFFVKGIPVFAPIEIVVQEENKFDENVKQTILNASKQAIAIAGSKLGGIPYELLPGLATKQIR